MVRELGSVAVPGETVVPLVMEESGPATPANGVGVVEPLYPVLPPIEVDPVEPLKPVEPPIEVEPV